MKNDNLDIAQQSLKLLLEKLRISFVVFIDDNFEKHPDFNKIIGWLSESLDNLPKPITDRFSDVDFSNYNVWQQQFIKNLENLSEEEKYTNAMFISQSLGKSLPHEEITDDNLRYLFNNNALFLSPNEWDAQKDILLASISPESRLLCFFDQDLSLSNGYTSDGSKSGIGLLKATKAQYGELAVCCLLSQRIEEIETEVAIWREMATDDLPLSSFLPLAKKRLGNDHSAFVFIDGIKKAALNSYFENLKQITSEIVKSSSEKALFDFNKLDPYDFDLMVLISSKKEGVWESETLIRIFQIFHKDEIFKSISHPDILNKISEIVNVARDISKVQLDNSVAYKYPQVRPVRKKELFIDASILKNMPLEVGDIFEVPQTEKYYILLGQPCDLMVREEGQRRNTNYILPLVALEKNSRDDVNAKGLDYWRTHYRLDSYFEKTEEIGVVTFPKSYAVSADLLDLCVIDEEGVCKIDIKQTIAPPSHMTDNWKKRIEKLIRKFKAFNSLLIKFKKEISNIKDDSVQKHIWQSAMPKLFLNNFGLPDIPYEDQIFDYKIKRVARLRNPGAERLLKAYTNYLSRDADEVDFASLLVENQTLPSDIES